MVSQTFTGNPAPLDAGELARALLPFGESRMLPPAAYTDEAVFGWERRNFFGDWVCLGLGAELPRPGDQRAEAYGDGSVLLVRGSDGALRAFANTCRHRGHELLPCGGQASQKSVSCPYHGWTYDLSGRLRGAAGYRDLDKSQWGLTELPVTEWHGLIFTGRPPAALGALDELVKPYEPERLAIAGRHTYDAAANWKILTENYHECYHCPSIHPELCRVSPPKSGANYPAAGAWIGGRMDLRDGMATMSLDGESRAVPLRGLSGEQLRTVIYVNIFPNVLWSLHPDYVMTHRMVPLTANRTRIECRWAFAPEAVAKPGFDPAYAVEFWDLTNRQDWAACESVQRGLSSPFASPGPLSPAEDAVYSFVTTVARGYLGGQAAGVRGTASPGRYCRRVTLFDIPVKTLSGQESSLGSLAGQTLLVVNVASKCGLTPQYTALEALHERLAPRGFSVAGFPCNQFGSQEPGTAEEIAEFCSATYGVTFPMFEKIDVNGPGRHPVYDVLTAFPDADGEAGDIQWNFEKFVLAPDGSVVARFRPRTEPDDPAVLAAIEETLPA